MKKIILTEAQTKKLANRLINEQHLDLTDRYSVELDCSVTAHQVTYKGWEIDWVPNVLINVSFLIDMDARSYGIKDINVYDIQGPTEVELMLEVYKEDADTTDEEYVTVQIDWSKISKQQNREAGWIGIDRDAEMYLKNDENGNIVVDSLEITTNDL
jgi:hypothetical protein